MRDALIQDGYEFAGALPFAFPVPAWSLDLEVVVDGKLPASARTILRLVGAGCRNVEDLARFMGFGSDTRLVATSATQLLERGALALVDGGLVQTDKAGVILATATLARQERASATAYFHPLDGSWSWKAPARPPNEVDWTIEFSTPFATPRERPDDIRRLVKADGVPELNNRKVGKVTEPVELLGLQELNPSTAYELVQIEHWRLVTPHGVVHKYVGRRDGEYDARLTKLLERARPVNKRRRYVIGGGNGSIDQ